MKLTTDLRRMIRKWKSRVASLKVAGETYYNVGDMQNYQKANDKISTINEIIDELETIVKE